MVHLDEAERRRRMVVRHHLDGSAGSIEQAVRDMLVLHSSDPLTPYLALRARVAGMQRDDVEAALYEDRTLWRLHAMRRTLFCVDPADAEDLYLAVGRKVARAERARVTKWVAAALQDADSEAAAGRNVEEPETWIAAVEQDLHAAVRAEGPVTTTALREAVPGLDLPLLLGSGRHTVTTPLASRLLYLAAMEGTILRTRPAGTWRGSQYGWVDPREWFGDRMPSMATYGPGARPPTTAEQSAAKIRVAERYLRTHGPATADDLRWFMGWTTTDTRTALAGLATAEVTTDHGPALVLADDLVMTPPPERPVVTFLPSLDPALMGWKGRGFYAGDLDVYPSPLFDRAGNPGPSILLDGWVVGGWSQRPDGEVAWRLLRDVDPVVRSQVAETAAQVEEWIGPDPVTTRFRTALDRELAAGG